MYAVPATPEGSVCVVITSGAGAIVTVYCTDVTSFTASVTVTVGVKTPSLVGVPLNNPFVDIVRPGGAPLIVKAYGVDPPVANSCDEYATPTWPLGSEFSRIETSGATTVNVKLLLNDTLVLSLTVTWNV